MVVSPSMSNKRQRHGGNIPPPMQQQRMHLTDFPDALLVRSAEYLSNTSCVSFAMALTSPRLMHQQPSTISKSIARSSRESWEYIDFKDMQDICGHSLNDNEVKWILLAIDGVHKIKSLKMTNCIGIVGDGLEPLRSSMILQYIDLSLVGDHESPNIDPEPPIDASVVVPILDSILGAEGNSFLHVQLPKKWREEKSNILTQFLQRFDRSMNDRRLRCSNPRCEDKICEGTDYYPIVQWQDRVERGFVDIYGINSLTCYQCMKVFCRECENGQSYFLCFCDGCEKYYCESCNKVAICDGRVCSTQSCGVCNTIKKW